MTPNQRRQRKSMAPTIAAFFLTAIGGIAVGLYSAARGNLLAEVASDSAVLVSAVFTELPNTLGTTPVHMLQPARSDGAGVTVNKVNDGSLMLIAGFFDGAPGLRLMQRDGTVIAKYPFLHSQQFPDSSFLAEDAPSTDWNTDLHGAVINPDGSVVANYEYGGSVKVDRCGKTIWTLQHQTHHSVERSEKGGYWIPGSGRLIPGPMAAAYSPLTDMRVEKDFREDLILKVSEDGKIEQQVSVTMILFDSGLEPLLSANGIIYYKDLWRDNDLVHLNKIAELPVRLAAAFPQFSAGDLMISLRIYNLIAVVDPTTWRVKWHQTGPWIRQHDPEFTTDGKIQVFNNNTYFNRLGPLDRSDLSVPRVSNILKLDPVMRKSEIVYGGRPGQEILSVIRGKQDELPEGHILVTEFEAGRAFEVDRNGTIVWEYISRYDDEFVTEVTEAKAYPASYFSVSDWTCGQN